MPFAKKSQLWAKIYFQEGLATKVFNARVTIAKRKFVLEDPKIKTVSMMMIAMLTTSAEWI